MSLEAGLFRDPDGKEQIPFPPYLRKDALCAALVKGFPPPCAGVREECSSRRADSGVEDTRPQLARDRLNPRAPQHSLVSLSVFATTRPTSGQ